MNTVVLFVWSPCSDCYLVINRNGVDIPSLEVPPSSRIPALVQRWCRERELRTAFISVIGGVGRTDGSVLWGAWVRLDEPNDRYAFAPLSAIEAETKDAARSTLATRLRTILRCSSSSTWIGHDPYWPEIVQAWIARQRRTSHVGVVVPIRAEAGSVVARATLDSRAVFFNARPLPFYDAEICRLLNRHCPNSFPETIAYDRLRGWWLTADIAAGDSKTFIEGDGGAHRLSSLMRGIATTQQTTASIDDVERLSFKISCDAIRTGVDRAVKASQVAGDWTASAHATLPERVDDLWEATGATGVPASWIHSDPSPDNVRVDERGKVVFIDLEDPWYGPLPLMGALALHSLSRRCGWTESERVNRCNCMWRDYLNACGLPPQRHALDDWLKMALLVRLVRGVEKAATEPPLLLYEETPRRSRAIARELHRLLGGS